MERGAEMKRSLLVNILIIMLVTLVVLVALVMVIITIVGKSVYSRQRANELMSRAESIASEFAFRGMPVSPMMRYEKTLSARA